MSKSLKLLGALFCAGLLSVIFSSCSKEEKGEPEQESVETTIRGYWICEYEDLALEIMSTSDYFTMKGIESECSSTDNVYQLWHIDGDNSQCYVSWSSQVEYFNFYNPNYSWRDKVYILSFEYDTLVLEGIDTYQFKRVTKQYFDNLINRSTGNSDSGNTGGSGDSGNSGGNDGGNTGGSSNHHYPCKSCDETGKCWNCYGTGTDPITNKKCNTCHGTGKCQTCNGRGYIIV